MGVHNELGKKGEQIATDLLIANGYQVLERNYRFQKAEVDIIALKNNTLAIIEVKTRASTVFGNPEDFVKPKQIKQLVKAVDAYLQARELDVEVRFDIIAITKQGTSYSTEHIQDAFYHF